MSIGAMEPPIKQSSSSVETSPRSSQVTTVSILKGAGSQLRSSRDAVSKSVMSSVNGAYAEPQQTRIKLVADKEANPAPRSKKSAAPKSKIRTEAAPLDRRGSNGGLSPVKGSGSWM